MVELKRYKVTGHPVQPNSKLPEVDAMKIQATDETDAIRQYRLLAGIDPQLSHRYSFSVRDLDAARRKRALAAASLRPVPAVTGYGFSK